MKTSAPFPIPVSKFCEFAGRAHEADWIIEGIFDELDTLLFRMEQNALSPEILADAVLSIASGTSFLGSFKTAKKKVGLVTDDDAVSRALVTVAAAKRISLGALDIPVFPWLPSLTCPSLLAEFARALEAAGIEVLVVDHNWVPVIANPRAEIETVCRAINHFQLALQSCCVTPFLAIRPPRYHGAAFERLAFSAAAEISGAWLTTSRPESYASGTGHHKLLMTGGGANRSAEAWRVTIDQGLITGSPEPRAWNVSVSGTGICARHSERPISERKMKLLPS